jgi:hypothetical protein
MPATPVGCVSVMPLCSTFYVYFNTHGCGSNCRRLLLAAGLVWLQCDHRVLTATHEFWCNPKATLLQGVQAQALHKSCLTSTHACCTLCCCKLVLAVAWVQGSRSSTAAHTECGAILIQQYQGVQAHCACSMCAKVMLYLHARLQQAAASLCSLVCDCYRVLTTAHRVVRAELTSNPCTQRQERFGHAAHT